MPAQGQAAGTWQGSRGLAKPGGAACCLARCPPRGEGVVPGYHPAPHPQRRALAASPLCPIPHPARCCGATDGLQGGCRQAEGGWGHQLCPNPSPLFAGIRCGTVFFPSIPPPQVWEAPIQQRALYPPCWESGGSHYGPDVGQAVPQGPTGRIPLIPTNREGSPSTAKGQWVPTAPRPW